MKLGNTLREFLKTGKDATASLVLERVLRHKFGKYGLLQNLFFDSRQKKIQIDVLLKGDRETLALTIDEYELVTDGPKRYFVIRKAGASREWIRLLLQDQAIGRPFPIPDRYATLVAAVL